MAQNWLASTGLVICPLPLRLHPHTPHTPLLLGHDSSPLSGSGPAFLCYVPSANTWSPFHLLPPSLICPHTNTHRRTLSSRVSRRPSVSAGEEGESEKEGEREREREKGMEAACESLLTRCIASPLSPFPLAPWHTFGICLLSPLSLSNLHTGRFTVSILICEHRSRSILLKARREREREREFFTRFRIVCSAKREQMMMRRVLITPIRSEHHQSIVPQSRAESRLFLRILDHIRTTCLQLCRHKEKQTLGCVTTAENDLMGLCKHCSVL